MLPQSAADFYRGQQRRAVLTMGLTRREWARMGSDFDRSWAVIGPRLVLLAASAQLGAARAAARYVPAVLAETGQPDEPMADLNPRAFAGTAADGRSMDGLLFGAVTTAKDAVSGGSSPAQALAVGGRWLDMAAQTLVVDAGRQATQVSIAMRANLGGYVRMANAPCCSRCAILAGKFFRFNEGFKRHPRCDCVHIPAREDTADEFRTDPNRLLSGGHITDLTPAEKQAVDLGANLNQVVNARRGSSGLRGLYTTEGTTRHGYASYIKREIARQRGEIAKETARRVGRRGYIKNSVERRIGPRPTPEAIYRFAHDREDALRLLRANGYIVGDISRVAASAV